MPTKKKPKKADAQNLFLPEGWQVEWIDPSDLVVPDWNPNEMAEDEEERLEGSVSTFGLVENIVVNRPAEGRATSNQILGGNHRVKKAIAKGLYERVPVVWVDLPDDWAMALSTALNQIGGEFNLDKLQSVFAEVAKSGKDALDFTGFSSEEVDEFLENISVDEVEWGDDEDDDKREAEGQDKEPGEMTGQEPQEPEEPEDDEGEETSKSPVTVKRFYTMRWGHFQETLTPQTYERFEEAFSQFKEEHPDRATMEEFITSLI